MAWRETRVPVEAGEAVESVYRGNQMKMCDCEKIGRTWCCRIAGFTFNELQEYHGPTCRKEDEEGAAEFRYEQEREEYENLRRMG